MVVRNWDPLKAPKEPVYNPEPLKVQLVNLDEWNTKVQRGEGISLSGKTCQFCKGTGLLKEKNEQGDNLYCHHCRNNLKSNGSLKFTFT